MDTDAVKQELKGLCRNALYMQHIWQRFTVDFGGTVPLIVGVWMLFV